MSHLMHITGSEDGGNIHELVSYLKATFTFQKIWMDPYGEPRVVVLCDKKLELRDIQNKSSNNSTVEISRYLDIAKPTTSVFVKTYKSITFGVKDKLKYLFTAQKYGGRKVMKVEQLGTNSDDCFEIFFMDWDDVLNVCNSTWKVEKQKLTVVPFFDSFKEPFNQQLKRLIDFNNTATPTEIGDTSIVLQKETVNVSPVMLKLNQMPLKTSSFQPSYSADTSVKAVSHSANIRTENQEHVSMQRAISSSSFSSVSDFTTDEEDPRTFSTGKQIYPHLGKKADLKSAKPVLEHPYILILLHLLNFEHAVQKKYNTVTVTICQSSWEVEITGPVTSLKIIQKLLTEEDELDHPALVKIFLGNEAALQDLKTLIDSAGLYVDIVDTKDKPFLQVRDGEEIKGTFHDFIFTLVVTKECYPLPSRECEKQTEWTNFVKSFQSTYTHQQIFVDDTSVTLLCLAPKSQEMDVIVNIINNIITQLKKVVPSDIKHGSYRDESVPNPDGIPQDSVLLDENSQSSGNTSSVGGRESYKGKKITIGTQNSMLLWILNILNLKKSVKHKTNDLDVDIDEDDEEIIIRGSKELVQKLKSVIMMEDKKFQFTEDQQNFLCSPVIRESLNSCLISHECCIVLHDDLEMFVASKNGYEARFRDFLTNFIQFKTVSHLAEKYHGTEEWNSQVEHVKNNYLHHHILTADDMVYLLSIAPDGKNPDAALILKEVYTTITALTSPVLQDKHMSSAEEMDDQKNEEIKTDSHKISAAPDKISTKKLTLYCHHPVLLWILNKLQLKEAAEKFGVCVTMHTDNEIILEGHKKTVKCLESVLLKKDNEMPFEDHEEFLTKNTQVKQHLDSCLKDSGAHLVLDDSLELFVVQNSKEKARFRDFLISFIQFKTVSDLEEKFQGAEEWNSLVEHVKNNYLHHHILTADDTVYLLSIAPDGKNPDAALILKEVNTTITALTSTVLQDKHTSSAEELTDQKNEQFKTDSQLIAAPDKISTKKVTLYCNHPVLHWILNNLQLKEAAEKFGVCVTMHTDNEIILEGHKKTVKCLESVLLKEDNEMPFEDHEEFLTRNTQVQQHLDSCLKDSGAHLVLDDSLELFVVLKSGEKEQFRTFITRVIQFRQCAHVPEKYQNNIAWKTLLEQFEKQNPLHHIHIYGEEVYLLTIACNDESHEADSIMERIKKAISDSLLFHDSDMSDEDEHHDLIFNCPKMRLRYLEGFLNNEYHLVCNRWESYRPKVTFMEEQIKISSSQDVNKQIQSQLKMLLSQIKLEKIQYDFPGLQIYLNSKGSNFINSLSGKYKCLIEVPDTGNSHPQHLSFNEEQSSEISQGLVYKVIFLGTIHCSGFNIHLVQGDINDLHLGMKVELEPSEEAESCEIKGKGSSINTVIQLPPWTAPNEASYNSHFEKLTASFHSVISMALEQAEYTEQHDVAFSTAHLTKSDHVFPASFIAKGIIEMLLEKTGFNQASSQTENTTLDIYICDPGNEAVFKAFIFFLKLRHMYLVAPSQVAWDNVCFPESYTCPDYNKSKGVHIEVSSNIPFSLGNNVCVFYPIDPSLEISTCPALKEHSSSERALKSSLSDLQRQNPDGLLTGEIFPLKGFSDGRNSFVYCSPDWGVYCDKAIDSILEECLKKSAPYDVIYIVPPGMQLLSKYPVAYLVQIFFRKLDSIIQSKPYLVHPKKCILLVQDEMYRKAFHLELQKRYPKVQETGLVQSILNWFKPSEQEKVSKNIPKTILKTSYVQSTVIAFWGAREHDIQMTAMELEDHLLSLMKKNTVIRQLNKGETNRFLSKVQNIHSRNTLVKISLKEWYEMESEFKTHSWKKKNKKNKGQRDEGKQYPNKIILSSSSLMIQGLDRSYLDEFLLKTDLAEHKTETVNSFIRETSQVGPNCSLKTPEKVTQKEISALPQTSNNTKQKKNGAALETSCKSHENTNSFEGSGTQQEQGSKTSQRGCASNSEQLEGRCHTWLIESGSNDGFQTTKAKTEQDIEDAYIKGKYILEIAGDITDVDFKSMTCVKNNSKTGIIRMDVLGKQPLTLKNPKLVKVKDNTDEFEQLMHKLDACIKKYNLSLVEVSKVQQNILHTRFDQKYNHLKPINHNSLWHRTSSYYSQSVCRYGFHPRFSGMPDAKHLGEGVLFHTEPEKCFNPEEEAEKEIHLVFSRVIVGKSGPGVPGLRCPPLDETTGERFHSVSEDGAYMIFSDAQACPDYVFTLQVK